MLRTYLYIAALLLLTTVIYLWDKNQPVTEKKPTIDEYTEEQWCLEEYTPPQEFIIENFTNPIEFAAILKNANIAYDTTLLYDNSNINISLNNHTKAMLLGVKAMDIMYKLIYEQDITKEKNVITQLAEDLKIDQYWNFENVGFTTDNLDTIVYLAVKGINSMWINKNNEPTAFLMEWGYWVEFTYIALKKSELKEIRDFAGEQKIIINEIFATNKHYQIPLIEKYAGKLKHLYEPVEVKIEYGDIVVQKEHGVNTFYMPETLFVSTPQPVIDSALVIITDIRNDLRRQLTIK